VSERYLGKSGWITENLPKNSLGQIEFNESHIDLVVRTYNVCDADKAKEIGLSPSYKVRVPKAVDRFHEDWPHQVGIVGFQEASDPAYEDPQKTSIPAFFTSQMERHGLAGGFVHEGELGISYDDEWVKEDPHQYWLLGKYKNNILPWPFDRHGESHMIHVRLVHRDNGWVVSVFNTHLAPRDWPERVKVRTEQLTNAIKHIRETVRAGELPPIFLGDFNFHASETVNYNIVNEYFSLVNEKGRGIQAADGRPYEVGIDHIWVGRPGPLKTVGNLIPLRCHTSGNSTFGIDLEGISDHSSPAISFNVEGAALLPTGPVAQGDDMQPGEVLLPGQSLTSSNGRFTFVYQADGNLVLYGPGGAMWASDTEGRVAGACIMQEDGNLVVYGPGWQGHWASATENNPGARLVVQDDGNVVIYNPAWTPIWATNA
jgi:hypothetical protein